jgi:hypothetical protein
MNAYYDVESVVEGAVDSFEDFDTWAEADAYAQTLAAKLDSARVEYQIHIFEHDHSRDDEEACVCRQDDADHSPDYASEASPQKGDPHGNTTSD